MQINPEAKTIKAMLNSGHQFLIPRFQREYSWDKKNYQEFFEDIIKGIVFGEEEQQYFLGTMLFIGSYTDSTKSTIQVVDGQQRLTTITILFSALSDIFIEIDKQQLSDTIFKYIMTTDDNGEEVKVLITQTSYPYFCNYIQDKTKDDAQDPVTEEEKCIFDTYNFFKNSLRESNLRKYFQKLNLNYINNENVIYLELLKSIRDRILNSLFVSISTDTKEKANMIFEILNAKGKRLASIDLIKNKIFEKLDKTQPADFAFDKWTNIKNNLNSRQETVGLATFYRHFWNSKYQKSSKKDLYDVFKSTIKTKEQCREHLYDLEKESAVYVQIVNPERSDYDNRKEYYDLVQSLNVLNKYFNIVQVRVVLLSLFDVKHRELINLNKFKEVVRFLERFHFIFNALTSNKSNKFDSIYINFASKLRQCSTTSEVNTLIFESFIPELKSLLPKYEVFEEAFMSLTYSKKNNPNNLKSKYVLNTMYCYYNMKPVFPDDGSIEHILPENDNDSTLNIGNLILLEDRLNKKVETKPYADKKANYIDSDYKEVKSFIAEHQDWKIADIQLRAKEMARIYYYDILKLN